VTDYRREAAAVTEPRPDLAHAYLVGYRLLLAASRDASHLPRRIEAETARVMQEHNVPGAQAASLVCMWTATASAHLASQLADAHGLPEEASLVAAYQLTRAVACLPPIDAGAALDLLERD
jgi:hypothetical protein